MGDVPFGQVRRRLRAPSRRDRDLDVARTCSTRRTTRAKRALIRLQQEKAKSLALTVEQALDEQVSRLGSIPLTGLSNSQRKRLLRPLLLGANVLAVSYIDPTGREVATVNRTVNVAEPRDDFGRTGPSSRRRDRRVSSSL